MGVLEARQEQPSRQVDHLRLRADQVVDLGVSDGGDPVAGDGDGCRAAAFGALGPRDPRGSRGEDRAAGEEEIGVHVHLSLVGCGQQLGRVGVGAVSRTEVGDLRTHFAHAAARKPEAIIRAG